MRAKKWMGFGFASTHPTQHIINPGYAGLRSKLIPETRPECPASAGESTRGVEEPLDVYFASAGFVIIYLFFLTTLKNTVQNHCLIQW